MLTALLFAATGCAPADYDGAGPVALRGLRLPGGAEVDLIVRGGRLEAVGPDLPWVGAEVQAFGRWVVPALIDSHFHLERQRDLGEVADGGLAGGVDLASAIEFLDADPGPLRLRRAGPMVTAVGGYPTEAIEDLGVQCDGAFEAAAAVEALAARGAGVIKLPITEAPVLDDAALRAAVDAAHDLGLRVASHAVRDEDALRAAAAGLDALAHTPTEALSEAALAAWAGGAVISTLRALGSTIEAVENLAALRAAGARVLYGTDLGAGRVYGVDSDEIALLIDAGLSGEEILTAATSAPAAYWGFDTLGAVAAGYDASFLILDADPRVEPEALAAPLEVWIQGVRRGGPR